MSHNTHTTIEIIRQLAQRAWGATVTVMSSGNGVLVTDGAANSAMFLASTVGDPMQAAHDYFVAELLLDGSDLADYGVQPETVEYWR